MKNLKMSAKLIISFLVVIVMAVTVGVVGIMGMRSINSADDKLYSHNLLAIDALGSIRENYAMQRTTYRDYVIHDAASAEFRNAKTKMEQLEKEMDVYISNYKKTITENSDEREFSSFTDSYYGTFNDIKKQLYALGQENEREQTLVLLTSTALQIATNIDEVLRSCYQYNLDASKDSLSKNTSLFNEMTVIEVVLLGFAVIIAIVFAFYISRLTSRPAIFMRDILQHIGMEGKLTFSDAEYAEAEAFASQRDEIGQSVKMLLTTVRRLAVVGGALETIAGGDLTSNLKLLSENDTMGVSLQKMIGSLNKMFREITESTVQVSAASKQIADGAQSLAQGSTEQASVVQELSASIGEIADKTKRNATIASEAAELSTSIKNNAEKGSNQMENMMQAVKEINDASSQIEKVIKVIDDIAFQTNILALNAAVEAARAGQHGKGFAVVAEEVRNLAAKSADAAKETGSLIENSVAKANLGLNIATETSSSLRDIVEGINRSAEIVEQIAQSSTEQAGAITQINSGIDQVAQVVQQNSATAQESAAASEQMSSQAKTLEMLISQFKIKAASQQPVAATETTRAFSLPTVTQSVTQYGSDTLTPLALASPNHAGLGKYGS